MYVNKKEQGEGDDDVVGAQSSKEFDESEVLNFVNGVDTLNVVVERPIAGCRPTDPNGMGEDDSYTLPSKGTKGLALVLNIVEFDDDITNVKRRYGSEQDMEYLTDLFIQLDYKLYPANQKIREQKSKSKMFLQSLIRQFKIECKRLRPKSIIVFIGSHGKHPNQICTSDYMWMDLYGDIVYTFTKDPDFTVLEGKPKIFLVQACQSYTNGGTIANDNPGQQSMIKDVYICTATMPGEPSMRHFYKGSWFPYCFTYMMMKHALKMKSLQQIMEMVKTMLGQIKNNNEFKQVPSNISINFDKPLYFVGSDYNSSGVRNYLKVPSWLQGAPKLCIVKTLDIQITCEKLRETLPKCFVRDWDKFVNFISSIECKPEEGMVDVVKGCTIDDLEWTLGALKEADREQVLLVTDDNEQKLRKFGIPVRIDEIKFEDLSPSYVLKIKERLQNKYGINLKKEQLNGELLVDIISGREMFRDELKPRQLSYYVNRMMLTRNIISQDIFKGTYPNDIFLIHGIKRSDLSLLVKHGITGRSQEQLENITAPFMTLDNISHFDKICKLTPKAVHVLNYENGKCRWVRSEGHMGAVQKHVAGDQDEQMEDDFCSLISSESAAPVCISDSPGMGKTILLAQIGRRLRRMFPDRTVLFVELSMFIQQVKETGITVDDAQGIVKALQDIVCKTLLGRHILKSKLTAGKVSVELLLDGFDEVRSTEIDFAHGILKTIRSAFGSIRMWVTSRPHKLEELEVTLGGLGYNIKPFQEQDQVNFLLRFWSQHDKLNTPRLEEFAKYCLKSIKSKMNSSEQDIAGIPLQCLLIGEVYKEKAAEHAEIGEESPLPDKFPISSITTLYQKVIKKKVMKYRKTFEQQIPNDEGSVRGVVKWLQGLGGKLLGWNASSKEIHEKLSEEKINDMHAHLGIALLFPDLYRKLNHTFEQLDMEEVLNVGIWEFALTTGPRFIHRTFAEYFVAQFIVEKLKSGSGWTKNLAVFFIEGVLQIQQKLSVNTEFAYPVIAYFFNSLLVTDSGDQKVILSLPDQVTHEINELLDNAEIMRQLVYASAYADCGNICEFLNQIGALSKYAGAIFDKKFITFAMTHSGVALIRLGFLQFEKIHGKEFDLEMQCDLLVQAVKLGNFSKVEFLIKEKGLWEIVKVTNEKTKMLLHHCMDITFANIDIDQQIDILKMLNGINGDLKEQQEDGEGGTPLFAGHAHVSLRIALIDLGANIMARNNNGDTFLHIGVKTLDKEHYHDLVKTMEERGNLAELVILENKLFQRTPLQTLIHFFDPLMETLQMFKDAGADFNWTDKDGTSVLMHGVQCLRNISTLKTLIKFGADKSYKTGDGETLLHAAAYRGDARTDVLNFLVNELKLDVNARDANGCTPLDVVLGTRVGDYPTSNYFKLGLTLFELGGRDTDAANKFRKDQSSEEFWMDHEIYVDIFLLHLYIFGSDETEYSHRSAMDVSAQTPEGMTSPPTFPLNYNYLKKVLIGKGAKENEYNRRMSYLSFDERNIVVGFIERLYKILHDTVKRTPPVWDKETIQLFQDGKLI